MQHNIILNCDSYKHSMWKQYPPKTEIVYDYIESRGGLYDKTVFFGIQAFIKEYLLKPITMENIDEAESFLKEHGLPFNREGWLYILNEYNGYLPLHIKAVPEGTNVPTSNVLVTVENIDEKCYWLVTHIETALLRAIWYPTTVATISKNIKDSIIPFLERTGNVDNIDYMLHDFGARGASSMETVGLGSMAHLLSFKGTDSITGILYANKYYDAGICGHSISATEHTSIISWGKDRELDAYRNLVEQFKDDGIVACVVDSYDVFNAINVLIGENLKQDIIDSNLKFAVRLDSGDPLEICSKAIVLLDEKFGHTINQKGFKILNNVKLVQGDGVTQDIIVQILECFEQMGYSADNILYGMGGALLQKLDRDTQKFAMKCSAVKIDGVWHDVQKDPITDKGKRSKKGLLKLTKYKDGKFVTINQSSDSLDECDDYLETTYYHGKEDDNYPLTFEIDFDTVKNNLENS